MRVMLAFLVAFLCSAAAGPVMAGSSGTSPEKIRSALSGVGLPTEMKLDADGDPMLFGFHAGLKYYVIFHPV